MATEQEGHTPGPVTISKCACGDPVCRQYTLSTQGSVGFSLADATLYAAAPDLLAAARRALNFIQNTEDEFGDNLPSGDALRAAIARATGEA